MSEQFVYPGNFVKVFFWVPAIILGSFISIVALFDFALITWLYDTYTSEQAKRVTTIFFVFLSSWFILISVWFVVLGVKSIFLEKYPPGNIFIPLKSKSLSGKRAKRGGVFLCAISLWLFLFSSALLYAQYISNNSSL